MEKVYVIQPIIDEDYRIEHEEIISLIESSDGVYAGTLYQKIREVNPATYIGEGKLSELKERLSGLDEITVLFNGALSPSQTLNISHVLDDRKVIDRTTLILDIFAKNAKSSEGKLQVELAQLKYMYPRLKGKGEALSRLGGGIGTRGPGETKLEVDRRRIHERISQLKSELQDVERHRDVVRKQREQSGTLTAAIVGYTNAGKSTLLNKLTGAGILAEDKLFATLDPTTRALTLPGGEKVLLTDTVGFIRKLPHHLVEAFKSTLEEARYCDVILHVVDCSNPQMDMQMHVVYETLRRLDIKDKEIITVFNKVDRPDADTACRDMSADYKVKLSAKTGEGIEELLDLFAIILRNRRIYFEKVFAYRDAGRIQTIRKSGQLLSEEYQDDGIHVKAYVPVELFEELYRD